MAVQWIKEDNTGSATITNNYVLTNKMFVEKFESCFSSIIGIDENKNILIKPITLDEYESPALKDVTKAKVSVQRSFIRFGNTKLVEQLKNQLNLDIPKEGIKAVTLWDEAEKSLVIRIGGDYSV